MNKLLNISQWEESNYSTSIEIELVLMKMLMIEMYSLIQMQQNTTNLYTKFFIFQLLFIIFNYWLNCWIHFDETNLMIYSLINLNRNLWNWLKNTLNFNEIIILYKNLIHFLDNIDFAEIFWSTSSIPIQIYRQTDYFEALNEANSMVQSAIKNIEYWLRYGGFCT